MHDGELRDRLRRLGVGKGTQAFRSPDRRPQQSIEALVQGQVMHTPEGAYFLAREEYALDHRHGTHRLSELLSHPALIPAYLARDPRLAELDLRKLAFLDTETTGLAGGTGTYAFLVGVGLFGKDGFEIRQFFMRDFDEEPAQMRALGELLDGLDAVVSFNGKSFDLPLLETRFVMARQPPRLVGAPHLDLLSPSRTFWRHRLESCALSSLEAEVLGVQRAQDDVPGWLIPSLYVDYTRTGDAREMPRIFYHNAQDILSLVVLAAHQCTLVTSPFSVDLPGEDLYGLARFYSDQGDWERAEEALRRAARSSRTPDVRASAQRELAFLLKRRERRQEALEWWRELATGSDAVYACEELAKHYEWHDVDLAQAIRWVERGIELAQAWTAGQKRREALEGLDHRLARLRLKAGHAGVPA